MKISFDPAKRQRTLETRGLDFADAGSVFEGNFYTQLDNRYEYPEPRYQTYGYLTDRLIMFAWTKTDDGIRVISMRKCNDREQYKFRAELGRR
ncbi:MAG: BrnT family toxin [Sphingomonadales bacterium]|nr:BrnT family toxin [Sphingomonadales bacterium]PIX65374.1 MAG: BrnT family toxin [Sphingomonadales bacterium CG_4_10_14_3_um_filter_58_15]NCO49547.1 BrnT family toxin [Sphingomonadales bacterium]NCP01140.1 BrnT family toxin [Sphingomonadales bacterium]NCP28079.1 BrnT family toxin [Sphingomonadales bacterium]